MDAVGFSYISRISPTPSGYLHLGNALNFVYVWLMARSHKAKLILRIDDLDKERVRSEYIDDIFRTLDWLGIDYDEGPSGPDELRKKYSQALRLDRYHEVISLLDPHSFVCTCTRSQILKSSSDGLYPGTCRNLDLDKKIVGKYCQRVLVPKSSLIQWDDLKQGPQQVDLYTSMRDFVILRKKGLPAYQIASLADDTDMGVNILVRGEELINSTAAQMFLAEKLGFSTFINAHFLHHPLLRDRDGEKLSKSAGALSIRELRKTSSKPEDVLTQIGQMLGCPAHTRVKRIHDLLLHINQIGGFEDLSI